MFRLPLHLRRAAFLQILGCSSLGRLHVIEESASESWRRYEQFLALLQRQIPRMLLRFVRVDFDGFG